MQCNLNVFCTPQLLLNFTIKGQCAPVLRSSLFRRTLHLSSPASAVQPPHSDEMRHYLPGSSTNSLTIQTMGNCRNERIWFRLHASIASSWEPLTVSANDRVSVVPLSLFLYLYIPLSLQQSTTSLQSQTAKETSSYRVSSVSTLLLIGRVHCLIDGANIDVVMFDIHIKETAGQCHNVALNIRMESPGTTGPWHDSSLYCTR